MNIPKIDNNRYTGLSVICVKEWPNSAILPIINNLEKKIVTIFKKFIDVDESIKRIPFYFFLVCVLLVVLTFKISQTNEYLKTLAEDSRNRVEYETFDDTFIEVETEDKKEKEDYIPLLEEVNDKESTTENQNNTSSDTITNKFDVTTSENSTATESSNDNVSRNTYVLNTTSKKIHLPDCSFVSRTKEENKKTVKLSTEDFNQYKYEYLNECPETN